MRVTNQEARKLGIAGARRPAKWRSRVKLIKGTFETYCEALGLPRPIPEYRFHANRRWRFDWAWVHIRLVGASGIHRFDPGLALEIDGVSPQGTRHQRIVGFLADQEKRNEAVIAGWRVLHCSPRMVETGEVFALLRRAFGLEPMA